LHFARDIAEGPPGVRILWPVQQTAWTASYWWFMGMIIVFTAARLILVTTGVPRTRVRLFQRGVAAVTAPSGGPAAAPDSTATTAGTHTWHSHCPAGSAGEHHGHDGSCTRGDDAPTSCRKPSALNATLRRPWDSPGPEVDGAMLGTCESAGRV
jgi:hypothetical protein